MSEKEIKIGTGVYNKLIKFCETTHNTKGMGGLVSFIIDEWLDQQIEKLKKEK